MADSSVRIPLRCRFGFHKPGAFVAPFTVLAGMEWWVCARCGQRYGRSIFASGGSRG